MYFFFVLIVSCDSKLVIMKSKNILGTELDLCCNDPITGFYRTGYCETGERDYGTHTVCAIITEEFLNFSLFASFQK